jgi:hypothetical protein
MTDAERVELALRRVAGRIKHGDKSGLRVELAVKEWMGQVADEILKLVMQTPQ